MGASMNGKIKVTLVRSKNHRSTDTLATLQTLGLKKVNASRILPDNCGTGSSVGQSSTTQRQIG